MNREEFFAKLAPLDEAGLKKGSPPLSGLGLVADFCGVSVESGQPVAR
jgi:hypothetical protein